MMTRLGDWIRQRITDYEPGVGRVFVCCKDCRRVVPYYKLYGRRTKVGCPNCGHIFFRPITLPEWHAALWLLWSWVTRNGDPRMPLRTAPDKYA